MFLCLLADVTHEKAIVLEKHEKHEKIKHYFRSSHEPPFDCSTGSRLRANGFVITNTALAMNKCKFNKSLFSLFRAFRVFRGQKFSGV
jgi:hypothetical protein